MSGLVLYNYFRSSTSYRARIALNIKNLSYDYKAINLLKKEQRSDEYLKINPLGGVPTLVHDGKVIADSGAIIEYLDQVFPQTPFFPQDPYMRAKVRQACEIINSSMHPMSNLKVTGYLETKHGFDQKAKEVWSQHWFGAGFEALEKLLQEFAGTYSFGNTVTAADLFLIPQILTASRFAVDMTPYPLLMKINDNCLKLEAFKKAHPFVQIDTPPELRA